MKDRGDGVMSDSGGQFMLVRGMPEPLPIQIRFDGPGTLRPRADVTALEAAHLAMMLFAATAPCGPFSTFDFSGFVAENGLERNFVKEEKL